MKEASVYLAPVTFGFGPASHAATIVSALRSRRDDLRIVGVADGSAAGFLADSGLFDRVLVQDKAGQVPALDDRPGSKVAVTIADFDRAAAFGQRSVPVLMVDALYWMWDRDPIDPASVDRYLCLAFPGVAERARAKGTAADIKIIPQILDALPPRTGHERAGVLLNFGGAVAPFGSNSEYLRALVTVVADVLGADRDLLVTCSAHAGELIRGGVPANVRVAQLTSAHMLAELCGRELLLTLPGLSIMWEALRSRIPTAVLPGANYSQHRQVVAYRRHFESTPILTWSGLPGYEELPAGMAEDQGGARSLGLGRRFAADPPARRFLADWLGDHIAGAIEPPTLVGHHPWSSFNGADHVAEEICAMLGRAE